MFIQHDIYFDHTVFHPIEHITKLRASENRSEAFFRSLLWVVRCFLPKLMMILVFLLNRYTWWRISFIHHDIYFDHMVFHPIDIKPFSHTPVYFSPAINAQGFLSFPGSAQILLQWSCERLRSARPRLAPQHRNKNKPTHRVSSRSFHHQIRKRSHTCRAGSCRRSQSKSLRFDTARISCSCPLDRNRSHAFPSEGPRPSASAHKLW